MGISLVGDVAVRQFLDVSGQLRTLADSVLANPGADAGALGAQVRSTDQAFDVLLDAAPALRDTLAPELRATFKDAVARSSTHVDTGRGFEDAANAADAVARAVAGEAPRARRVSVVVGGGGPAGLTTANLLRQAGADVRVAYPGAPVRHGSVMIHRDVWPILRKAGGGQVVDEAPVDPTGAYNMAAIPWVEDVLARRSAELGVHVDPTRAVTAAEQLDDGVRVSLTSTADDAPSQTVDADWYVDASGGASPVARSAAFEREVFDGKFAALPKHRSYIAQSARAITDRDLGWAAQDGSFAINDVRSGVLTAYRGVDGVLDDGPLSAREGAALLRSVDVDPATATGTPWSFAGVQRVARSAGEGRVLLVGDAAGTVIPVTQAGVRMALHDAVRAVDTITRAQAVMRSAIHGATGTYLERIRAHPQIGTTDAVAALRDIAHTAARDADDGIAEAVRRHSDQTRAMHQVFLA